MTPDVPAESVIMSVRTTELVDETSYIWRARRPESSHRLICLPHAGAGAAAYADWAALLPPEIELVAVQLPGRQNRIAEPAFTAAGPLIRTLSHALRPVIERPYSFFGHSCGAILGFELARALRARGRRGPDHLFMSAQPAPGFTGVRRMSELSEAQFRAEMLTLGGIDPEIVADPLVLDSLMPILRTDFALWEDHLVAPGAPLDCPITVLCGDNDPRTPAGSTDGWRAHTTGAFATRSYPGGHFYFLDPGAANVVSALSRAILTSERSVA
jgi:surfactin synthase thioesterase subunit